MIRQSILKYFHDRDCITLVRPVDNDEDLKKLNKIPFDKLKVDFRNEFIELKDKIYKDSNPKRFNGKKLNGPTLANLLHEFVDVINKGGIPNINNA